MRTPRVSTELERQALLAEARAEFPGDEMMQEVHYVRLLHSAQFQGFSRDERLSVLNKLLPSCTDKR
jgi:hypothetical protein